MTTCSGPQAPSVAGAAERARTAATRTAAAVCLPGHEPARPLAHATTANGQVLVLVPADGEVAGAVQERADVSALLMVSDRAPVPLRDPVRATLWLSGWLTPVPVADRTAAALAFAEVRPEGALLDVGGAAALLRLDLAEVVLREGGGCTEVSPAGFAAARPDPLAAVEAGVLQHLERDHPDVLAVLRSRVAVGPGEVVRPLGVDRFGYRLRVERPGGHRDVRVPFPRPLTCPGQLRAATSQLLCALRAGLTRRD
ncbi:uncharacterized protein DUF2470 [Geodermatophilus tzadiensis]|uniref:Uncharacterized protein DUF2470 n=1 Tax=Geodermatophilus tzadiensis TaxID=1137988 RepID=A0A2T0TPG8_9ACTN|nr:DUF2470 domain-containing protein [Geodermatophilus tzadiensis]PRY47612.1 uncharacterized protein DUF2470 [Geodermatophilus tzadiensis]